MSISDGTVANMHVVADNLEAVRAVAECPASEGLLAIQRTVSASSFESLHSIDHGSLGVEEFLNTQLPALSKDGPWTVYTRKPDSPACYQAKFQPATHPFPRPPPPHASPEYQDSDLETNGACS